MKILAIYPWTHISSAALMMNGKLIAASPEERFTRTKWTTQFPIQSANWCLKQAKLQWKDIDRIVVPWNPSLNINSASSRWDGNISWRGEMLSHIPSNVMKALNTKPSKKMIISFDKTKIIYLNHHDCHAASAIFVSPFKKCDYLTIDGHGEKETCLFGYYDGKKLNNTHSISYPHSVGLLYGTFTDFLGFKPDNDEWKTMALASFSKSRNLYDKKMNSIYKLTKDGFELDLSFFDYYLFDRQPHFYNKKLTSLFGKPRNKDEKITDKHHQVAGALQRAFTNIVFHLLKITKQKGGKSNNIVIAGGAAMNCVFNGLLENNNTYKNNFVPPWPDDLGVSIGATYLENHNLGKKSKNECQVYLGPGYSNADILTLLKKFNLTFFKPDNISRYIAERISKGHLIGWFQNRMEFTHRALGNRSILADPRKIEMQLKVNSAVKYRETFRPFAPAVLEEHASKIFMIKKKIKVPFMEKAVFVRNSWKKKIAAVVHVDGTARVQTVNKKSNLSFYNLINEFYKITNVPVLLNTSFNLNGEPIVMTPSDAIRTFHTCGLDTLVLQDYVILKKTNK
jgi:carbamoyltransferase